MTRVSIYFPYVLALFTMTSIRGGRLLLALYALELDAAPFTVGLLAATFSALPMMLSLTAGKLSDRFGPRWPLFFGILGATLGILVPFFFRSVPALFVAAVMNGFAFTFYNVSLQNTIGLLSTPETRVKNYANFTLVASTGQMLAPLIMGFSIEHIGAPSSCLVTAALAITPLAMLLALGGGLPKGRGKPAKEARGNLLHALKEPGVAKVLAVSSLIVSAQDLFQFYMPIYGHSLGLSASRIGFILASYAVAAFLARSALSWLLKRASVQQVLTGAFAIGAAVTMLFPFFQNEYMLCLIAFLFGVGISVGQPITMSLSFSNAREGRSGEAMGMRMTVNHSTRVLVPVIFGSLASAFGLYVVFGVSALMMASGSLLARSGNLGPEGK
jgi:MFS family permease